MTGLNIRDRVKELRRVKASELIPNTRNWLRHPRSQADTLQGIQVYSTYEHYLLPFFGKVAIGYIPPGKVIGVSKLARIVDACARRLQIQEQLNRRVGELLAPYVLGVGVRVEAQHLWMKARVVSQQGSALVTNYLTGPFREKPEARAELFAAIRCTSHYSMCRTMTDELMACLVIS
jgi:GTP cyclohydrolase I